MTIALGSDHAGFVIKETVKRQLLGIGHTVRDFGCYDAVSCDYPDYVIPAAEAVARGECDRGIVFGGSGNGEAIAANKIRGIRAGLCWTVEAAQLNRRHNDGNVLSLGERLIPAAVVPEIVAAWLETPFEGGRHSRRVEKLGACGSEPRTAQTRQRV